MRIKQITVGNIYENAYFIDCGDKSVLIDPGAQPEYIEKEMGESKCAYVLLTHAHFDHISAVRYFQRKGAAVYMHRDDMKLLNGKGNLAEMFGERLEPFTPDVLLNGGETLNLSGLEVKVISTPGHTDGSVCYISSDVIFSGDTLFFMSCGRTDFPSGSSEKMRRSLNNLMLLADKQDYKVYAGHGIATTLSAEKKSNPYV